MPIQTFLVVPPQPSGPGTATLTADPSLDPALSAPFPAGSAVVPIESYQLGVTETVTIGSAAAGAGVGKAVLHTLNVTKPVDRTSPQLFRAAATGGRFAAVQLIVRDSTANRIVFGFEIQTAYVSEINWSGVPDSDQQESVVFTYGALAMAYQPLNANGAPAPVVKGSWNQITGNPSVVDTLPIK